MTKEQREEAIATLTACKYSGFTPDDKAMLEAAGDARLEAFLTVAAARKTEAEKAATEPKVMTEEEFMKVAPTSVKTLIARQQKQESETKTALVAGLKAAQSEYSEAELAAMNVEQLERLARMTKTPVELPDFSSRGLPRAAAAKENDVFANPPDAYAEALKKRRQA